MGNRIETFKYVKGLNKAQEGSVFNRKLNTRTRRHNLKAGENITLLRE